MEGRKEARTAGVDQARSPDLSRTQGESYQNILWIFPVFYNDSFGSEIQYVVKQDTAKQGLCPE